MGKKATKSSSGKQRPPKQKTTVPRLLNSRLDSQAAAYAELLLNPCAADLVHPVYAGSSGGILARTEVTSTFFNGANIVGGVVQWLPGAFSLNAGNALNQFILSNPGSGGTVGYGNALTLPGSGLANGASAIRCVAACMQVYWAGTELNRQGFITAGNTIGNSYPANAIFTSNSGSTLLPFYMRMPGDCFEIKWRPTDADQEFVGPTDNIGPITLNNHGALTVNVDGLPVGTGVRIRMVAVYEYIPSLTAGIAMSTNSKNRSRFTLDSVLNALDSLGDWTVSAGRFAGRALGMASKIMGPTGQAIMGAAPLLLM